MADVGRLGTADASATACSNSFAYLQRRRQDAPSRANRLRERHPRSAKHAQIRRANVPAWQERGKVKRNPGAERHVGH